MKMELLEFNKNYIIKLQVVSMKGIPLFTGNEQEIGYLTRALKFLI